MENDMSDTIEEATVFPPYELNTAGYKAWQQGAESRALQLEDQTPNPYLDTDDEVCKTAWADGYLGYGAQPSDFNVLEAMAMTEDEGVIQSSNRIYRDPTSVTAREMKYVIYFEYAAWRDNREEKVRPKWSYLPIQHRSIEVGKDAVRRMTALAVSDVELLGKGFLELPCPPYDFEQDGSQLKISAGVYAKSGTKEDWEAVLETMREEVDAMPEGTNVEDDTIEVRVTATIYGTVSLYTTNLLDDDPHLEDGVWVGTFEEYEEAISAAISALTRYGDDVDEEVYVYENDAPEWRYEDDDIDASNITTW